MSVENNETVLFTTWDPSAVETIKTWLTTIDKEFRSLFVFVPTIINNKVTVIMVPDGSKKGWNIDIQIVKIRTDFISLLTNLYGAWVEVGYGEYGQTILQGNCENQFNDEIYYKGDQG